MKPLGRVNASLKSVYHQSGRHEHLFKTALHFIRHLLGYFSVDDLMSGHITETDTFG